MYTYIYVHTYFYQAMKYRNNEYLTLKLKLTHKYE